jgi:hypothetical protein
MAREHYPLDQDFTIQGHWWRPGGQHRPAGELSYAVRKLELRLVGAFDDAEGEHPLKRMLPVMEPPVCVSKSPYVQPFLGKTATHSVVE